MYPRKIMAHLIILALPCLLPCFTAQDLACTVFQLNNGQTVYRIPDSNHSKCESSWSKPDNTVLATQPINQPQPGTNVVSNNETTLITKTCMNVTLYKRDCTSEESVRTATCIATCTVLSDPGKGPDIGKIFVNVAIAVTVSVLLCVVIIISYHAIRHRNKIREMARSFLNWPDPRTPDEPDADAPLTLVSSPLGPNPGP